MIYSKLLHGGITKSKFKICLRFYKMTKFLCSKTVYCNRYIKQLVLKTFGILLIYLYQRFLVKKKKHQFCLFLLIFKVCQEIFLASRY